MSDGPVPGIDSPEGETPEEKERRMTELKEELEKVGVSETMDISWWPDTVVGSCGTLYFFRDTIRMTLDVGTGYSQTSLNAIIFFRPVTMYHY